MLNCAVESGMPYPSWQTRNLKTYRLRDRELSGAGKPFLQHRKTPFVHWDPPSWSPELPRQKVMRAHWASCHLTSCVVRGMTSINYCSQGPQWPLGTQCRRCSISAPFSFLLPMPWSQDLTSKHSELRCETTQSVPKQLFRVCECWGEPQEIQLVSGGVYTKDGVSCFCFYQ